MKTKLLSLLLAMLMLASPVWSAAAFADGETYTVSFAPGTGTGSMDAVTVNAGADYTLPACGFTHTNSERVFYKWSVGGALKDPGDTITVDADTTVTAKWQYQAASSLVNNTEDRSATNYVGKLVMTDSRTGGQTTEVLYDETVASTYTDPMNSAVGSLAGNCAATLMTAVYTYPDPHNISTDMPTLDADHAEIVDSWNHITYRAETTPDDEGDYALTMYMEGDYGRAWRYTETVTGEYTSPEPIPSVSLTFTPPAVGTTITITDYESDIKPVLTLPTGETRYFAYGGYPEWQREDSFTIEAGQTYSLYMQVKPEDGYCFDGNTAVSATNATVNSHTLYEDQVMGIVLSFTATGGDPTPAASFFGVLITDAEGSGNTSGSRYWIDYPGMEGDVSRSTASNNFVEDGSNVYLEAYPAAGYKFVGWYQGDPDKTDGKLYVGEPLTTNRVYQFEAPIGLARPYICAVFDVDTSPQGDQVQMWVGNTQVLGPNSSAQGGKVAVKYTPSYDIYPEIRAKSGTDFVAGEVLLFYKGDECTVYEQPDEGFRFVGWYHVNIAWAPGEDLAWQGSAISTATSFTYKPGVTVVPGDTEPLRYVCAVFEALPPSPTTYTVSVSNDGNGTGAANPASGVEGSEIKLTATPNTGYRFKEWQVVSGGVTVADNKFTLGSSDVEIRAIFELIPTYAVTFHVDGGTEVPDQTIVEGGKATKPADPIKEGYVFNGWYRDAAFAAAFDFNTAITADTTVYAKWAAASYVLTSVAGATADASHTWRKDSSTDVVITVKLNDGVDHSFDHFTGVQFDGIALVDGTDYTAREGSTVVTLKAAMLQNRSIGAHTVTILFDNGNVQTNLTIRPKSLTPSTGDSGLTALWAMLTAVSCLALRATVITGKKRRMKSNKRDL